jgi:hypothetical protein
MHIRLIITGYVCSTTTGVPTTLKRNGSDFSAALFGHILKVRTPYRKRGDILSLSVAHFSLSLSLSYVYSTTLCVPTKA